MSELAMKRSYEFNGFVGYVTMNPRTVSRKTSLFFDLNSIAEAVGLDLSTVMEIISYDLVAKGAVALVRVDGTLRNSINANKVGYLFMLMGFRHDRDRISAAMSDCLKMMEALRHEVN